MRAPPTSPDSDTVFARYPAHDVTPLIARAGTILPAIASPALSIDAAVVRLHSHRTVAAAAGTERLSSSRTGIVSINAATSAAASGAATTNHHDGGGATAGRVHAAQATAPRPPNTMKPIVPATVFSPFQGSVLRGAHWPTSVA